MTTYEHHWQKENKYRRGIPASINRLAELFDATKGTPESDEADVLALLVDDYEKSECNGAF